MARARESPLVEDASAHSLHSRRPWKSNGKSHATTIARQRLRRTFRARSKASLYANARSLLDGVHPDDRRRVSEALLGMPHGEYNIEYRVLRPDSEIRWVWSRGFPVCGEPGKVVRVAGITEDITTRKVAEMERERVTEAGRD